MTERVAWRFEAIGTAWEIETRDPLPDEARAAVDALIEAFDVAWSRFRPDSLVLALTVSGGGAPAPPDTVPMLDALAALSDATGGAVNPLVGAALAARGDDAGLSLVDRGPSPAPHAWRDLLSWSDDRIELRAPETIDVGALGKGRLVDLVLETLLPWVSGDVVVDASGDLAVRGAPLRVGLEHPFDTRRVIGVWEVTDAALCASAINRRAWGDGLHHVLDARTGEPVRTIAATWAVAPRAMEADGIATALFFDGGPEIAHDLGVEWVRMMTDGRVEWSPTSKAELFL